MTAPRVLRDGIVFGESPRWHDGRLWFCDWGARQILAVAPDGSGEVVLEVDFHSLPMCIDFLPDGRLLVVCSPRRQLLRREADGRLVVHAELGAISDQPWNEVVCDRHGTAYLNNSGFDFPREEPRPGLLAVVGPDGAARRIAGDLMFPNGMALTLEERTLLVGESHSSRVTAFELDDEGGVVGRRAWAQTPGDHPDGVTLDADGALWYADVGNSRCVRIREGGEVLDTVQLDRGCFSCALGGADGRTLFIVAQRYDSAPGSGPASGQLLAVDVDVPGAGWA